ncbi:MAG TPA: ASKHA domain-containing protein [Candidatus Limiplasma sp.]|nr:ASKHA domain-containing protein [Candidatus Limiplasma sp.]HPS81196.1 ASKHA domain-containing protein [Candidatus Limiplasma sp.]
MPTLTIVRGPKTAAHAFAGTPTLAEALSDAGFAVDQPCGGRGTCRKCAVTEVRGELSAPTQAETEAGQRLACQARLLGNCTVTLPAEINWVLIETQGAQATPGLPMAGRYGAAVDLGTTTIGARVYELATGRLLAESALVNPQTAVAADVMGRISAALAGGLEKLSAMARGAIARCVAQACATADIPCVEAMTVAGNTVMLTLLTGRNPRSLASAPFVADELFGGEWPEPLAGARLYLPPCAGAFMGADITCAALSTGLCEQPDTVLLADIGTNGELMLWHRGALYAASTAAGPAFEGGEISQGCGSVRGAIDKVWVEQGGLGAHVLGGGEATGLCGSGLLDAVAALLSLGRLDSTGASDAPAFALRDGISLSAGDIRALQLAKAAVAAGIETLLVAAGALPSDVKRLDLAGGFGSRLNVASAVAVGLIPAALAGRAHAVGNASLAGAAALLLDTRLRPKAEWIARTAQIVQLGGDAGFERRFLAAMTFPWAEETL